MLRKFGRKVRRYRGYCNYTLAELAAASCVTKGVLSQIENGKGNPTIVTISRLAKGFRIAPSELLSNNN